jgi:hypothetical protein
MPTDGASTVWYAKRKTGRLRTNRKVLAALFTLALLAQQWPARKASAMPLLYTISELARTSDVVVVAQVESIRRLPLSRNRLATAKVTQVWKGGHFDKIRFLISPRDFCDISDAKRGEIALLFLTKEVRSKRRIENSGRGRMPLCVIAGKQCVRYFDIAFPSGTRVVELKESPDSEFNAAVEIDTVRKLVDDAISHHLPAAPDPRPFSPLECDPSSSRQGSLGALAEAKR